jgi:hypothetical protein
MFRISVFVCTFLLLAGYVLPMAAQEAPTSESAILPPATTFYGCVKQFNRSHQDRKCQHEVQSDRAQDSLESGRTTRTKRGSWTARATRTLGTARASGNTRTSGNFCG